MSHLYAPVKVESSYARKNWNGTPEEYKHALDTSCTVYVGNLSFFTREEQIWELFSKVGEVKRIVMGLNKFELTPCGFCFVEYYTHEAAADCVNYVSGTKLDERVIRADWDTGFVEGRQYGRGSTGGQVRDDFREYFDPERGDKQRGGHSSNPEQHQPSVRQSSSSSSSQHGHHFEDRHGDREDHHRGRGPPAQFGKGFSPSHDRPPYHEHDRYGDHRRGNYDDSDRYGHGGHRDYRDRYEGDSRHHGFPSRDYHGHDSRHRRGRDDYDQRGAMEPSVDEFGRDIPTAKKPKLSER